jgi:hypothetical protein
MAPTVFPIAKSPPFEWRWYYAIPIVLLSLGLLFPLILSYWPGQVWFEVTPAGLTIRGSIYGRTVPTAQIRLDGTRRLTTNDTPGIYPKWRTNGTGARDYSAGWFKLNDGRKALLFVTDWSRTIVVPTTAGYDMVLSPEEPDALVAAIASPPQPAEAPRKFPLASAPARDWEFFDLIPWLPSILVPLVIAGVFIPLLLASRKVKFELSDGSLRIKGDLYGRTIPISDLRIAEASIIDMKTHPTFGRMLRINGVGLPNYLSGWFRPKGGGRALLFVTDQTRVVAVPTTAGYELLVSPAAPEAFLTTLQGGSA